MSDRSALLEGDAAVTVDVATLFTDGARSEALIDWAEREGMHPACALLASELARASQDGQTAFVESLLQAVRGDGGDALRWLLWLWRGAASPIRARFTDPADEREAQAVMDMHRRVLDGVPIDSNGWRQARRSFAAAMTASAPSEAVEAVLSSMWDVQTTPGSIADAAQAWITQAAAADALAPAGWTDAERARVTAAWDDYGIEHARHNRRRSDETDEMYGVRMDDYMRDNPVPLTPEDFSRWSAWKEHQQRLTAERTAELRAGLLAIVRRQDA